MVCVCERFIRRAGRPGSTAGRMPAATHMVRPISRWQDNFLKILLLRQSPQSNKLTPLAMEKKFQLNQPRQTLEQPRLGQEMGRRLSHQIRAARATDAGAARRE